MKFRNFVKSIDSDIEPFHCASTIAKLALEIWRSKFLQPNKLVNFPEEGLNRRQQQSRDALRFFKLYSKLTGKRLRTAEWSVGEHLASEDSGFRVDALVLNETKHGKKIALEYYGCRFHGNFFLEF